MSQSNVISSINEKISPTTTKKPLALVQPVIRDPTRRLNLDQSEKINSSNQQEPLSYVSQPRKLPTQMSYDQP